MNGARTACAQVGGWIASGQLGAHLRAWLRLRWQAWRLRRSARFDPHWYRAAYPDLGPAIDPALHYLRGGAAEGRAPLPVAAPPPPRLPPDDAAYQRWIAAYDWVDPARQAETRRAIARMPWRPVIGVVLLDGAPDALAATRAALAGQLYPDWRLTAQAEGDVVVFLPAGTALAPTALFELAAAVAAAPHAALFYADQDRVDATGRRTAPWFKPDWDPVLAAECDLLDVTGAYRCTLLARLGVTTVRDRLALRALACRAARAAAPDAVRHVPAVLFHVGTSSPECGAPLVSVIVPTRDRADLLARCTESLLRRTDYPAIELIIVDNDSRRRAATRLLARLATDARVRVLRFPGPFNWSAMNNAAARLARGTVLALLNNDIEAIHPDWLREMVALAQRPEIGVVGARLLYPDGRVQHAGMTIGPGAVATHLLRGAARNAAGYGGMLRYTRSVAAVTGACMVMRRAVFDEVGGFECEHLAITGNDVDFCLRVRARGWRVVCTPRAELYHHEAASRGLDASAAQLERVRRERAYLLATWGPLAEQDPYLAPNLATVNETIVLAPPVASPGRAIAGELFGDALDIGEQVGRQPGGGERGAADIERVGQPAEAARDCGGDVPVGADGGEQRHHVVGDLGGHVSPLPGLRHGVELAAEIAEAV